MPIKPDSRLLTSLFVALSTLALIGELGRGGLRVALAKVSKGARIFRHPLTWFKVVKVLTAPETQPVVRADPRIVVKYLGGYLGEGLSPSEKASFLIHHYTFLKDRVEQDFFRRIVGGRIKLWEHGVRSRLYRICVTFSRPYHNEGDLSLVFQHDHLDIYTLSFTIGPGSVAGLTADHAIFIGRLQGKGKELPLIRESTKDCLDISPAALLLAATAGIAAALELGDTVGIGADELISPSPDSPPGGLVHAYDEFWMASGGVRLVRNMYHLPVPLPEKPIEAVKRNHRPRARRKRAFRKFVMEQVCREFSTVALRSRDR